MKKSKPFQRSPLALGLLALLTEEPMHPYRMQQLLKERGKHDVINIRQRASIYQMIDRLERDGLIQVRETEKEEGRPDRTIYEATPVGRSTLQAWMREMISTVVQEFPEFPAALAFIALLDDADARVQLEKRAAQYEAGIALLDDEVHAVESFLPRLFLLETEYKRAVMVAELEWVRGVIADLQSGKLAWHEEWLREVSAKLDAPDETK